MFPPPQKVCFLLLFCTCLNFDCFLLGIYYYCYHYYHYSVTLRKHFILLTQKKILKILRVYLSCVGYLAIMQQGPGLGPQFTHKNKRGMILKD